MGVAAAEDARQGPETVQTEHSRPASSRGPQERPRAETSPHNCQQRKGLFLKPLSLGEVCCAAKKPKQALFAVFRNHHGTGRSPLGATCSPGVRDVIWHIQTSDTFGSGTSALPPEQSEFTFHAMSSHVWNMRGSPGLTQTFTCVYKYMLDPHR